MKKCLGCQSEFEGDAPLCQECYFEKLPKCPKCKQTFIWIKAGDQAKHDFWEGYYRCQNKCTDPSSPGGWTMYKIKDREVFAKLKRTTAEKLNLFK